MASGKQSGHDAAVVCAAGVAMLPLEGQPGLTSAEVLVRRAEVGRNVLRSHSPQPLALLARQFRSPLLMLLLASAAVAALVGQRTESALIALIVVSSTALGFFNEYRAQRTAAVLHERIRHTVPVLRDGIWDLLPLVDIVPGDLVSLFRGSVVPADVRLVQATALEVDESVLTGESVPVAKHAATRKRADGLRADGGGADDQAVEPIDPATVLRMGTVVRTGEAQGIVTATGGRTEFGRIAVALGSRHPDTTFQKGLRNYSLMLARVAVALAAFVFVANVVRGRSTIDALLFSLAIAVGITPELLPAVVTTSLAAGARRLAERKVLVKRLICIEDLGNISVLLTDKTGTLTEGAVQFSGAFEVARAADDVLVLGALGGTPSWERPDGASHTVADALTAASGGVSVLLSSWTVADRLPFDHDRMLGSVRATDAQGMTWIITTGAPEAVHARCTAVSAEALAIADTQFAAGARLLAVAVRPTNRSGPIDPNEESGLELAGYLSFADPVKPSSSASIARLGQLDITVKVATGDNPVVACRTCAELGMDVVGVMTGADIDAVDDATLATLAASTTVFARVGPAHKARVLRALRSQGHGVAFLGDGVNDAEALHAADVGISVESGADVARDAADVVLLEKDLGVLADGVMEGRRIFANTMKYVLMGTSSAFGNMLSASAASLFLSFLPMLPAQILLNNLLYESSQLTIPTDRVDAEQLRRPAQWDLRLIRRTMATFGPLSSAYDFVTFGVLIWVLHASTDAFRTAWFVESLVTQTAVIFVIRTRRRPFWSSRPSAALLASTLTCVVIAVAIGMTPLGSAVGFVRLPVGHVALLGLLAVAYLITVDLAKERIRGSLGTAVVRPPSVEPERHERRIHRRAAPWSHGERHAFPHASGIGSRITTDQRVHQVQPSHDGPAQQRSHHDDIPHIG